MAVKPEPQETTIPTLPVLPQPTDESTPRKADPAEKSDALKRISDHRKAIAWPVFRWPINRYIVQEKTKLHLPRSYLSKAGEDVKTVWPGDDLNQVVYQHYYRKVVAEDLGKIMAGKECANYVAADGIVMQRHEYLGPDPRVAGYRFDVDGEVHVKWWDSFLQDLWMDRGKWQFGLRDDGGKWVEVDD